MERISENVQQRLHEAMEECDRALDGGDAHDLLDAVENAQGAMFAALDLLQSLPTDALNYVKWLEAELDKRVPRWISVEERLPGDQRNILTVNGHGLIRIMGLLHRVGDKWSWIHNERIKCYNDITHWMPLPEPPEEELEGHYYAD